MKKSNIPFKMKGFSGFMTKTKKKLKNKLNQSTLTNPRTADEIMSDAMDRRQYSRLLQEHNKRLEKGIKSSKAELNMLKHYSDKSKKKRPNKKNKF